MESAMQGWAACCSNQYERKEKRERTNIIGHESYSLTHWDSWNANRRKSGSVSMSRFEQTFKGGNRKRGAPL